MGMGLTYPFALVVVYAVLGGSAVLALVTRRSWANAALWSGVSIVAATAPLVVYYVMVFWSDPLWHSTHVIGNKTGAPPLLSAAFGYGLVLVYAVAGVARILRGRRWQSRGPWNLVVWVAIHGILPYAPVSFQGRFAAGWHVALVLLGSWGIEWLRGRFAPDHAQRVRNIAVILTIPSTLLILMAGPYMAVIQGTYPFYLPWDELRAMDWLSERVDRRDVVLASYPIGNTIPTRVSCRVLVGHQFESYDLNAKLDAVKSFFGANTSDAEREATLREYGVTWVYYGHIERDMGGFDPSRARYLTRMYDAGGVAIYAIGVE
jgi:hypothetical protein